MDHIDIIKQIQAGKYKPIYLLHGDESYYIDKIAEFIENNILTPDQKDFNCTVFYGKDTTPQTVIDACRRFPMFADYNVVIVREAQMMKDRGYELEKLDVYAENPSPSTILVICHKDGKFDARKKLFKLIKEKGLVFESAVLKESEIPAFIGGYLKRKKVAADSHAIHLLVDHLGSDLARITNELDKLCINLKEGQKISPELIEKNIGISKDYNVYELQSALLTKDSEKAFKIVDYLNSTPKSNPFVLTITNIFAAYQKLYHFLIGGNVGDWELWKVYQIHSSQSEDYKRARSLYTTQQVEEIFEIILEYDLRYKGVYNVETPPTELLKELVYRVMN